MLATALAMDPWTIAAFIGASILLYLTPGPDMMFTLASGAAGGPVAGLAAAGGAALGSLTHSIAAAVGLAVLVAASPVALDAIRYAGAAYLFWLAWVSWRTTSAPGQRGGRADALRALRRGYVTNLLNPKVALFVLAFLPQFTDPQLGSVARQMLVLGVILAIGGVLTNGLFGIFAGLLTDRLARSAVVMNRVVAVIFGGLAARLVVS